MPDAPYPVIQRSYIGRPEAFLIHKSPDLPQRRRECVIGKSTPSFPWIGLQLLVGRLRKMTDAGRNDSDPISMTRLPSCGIWKHFAQAGKNLHAREVEIAEESNRQRRLARRQRRRGLACTKFPTSTHRHALHGGMYDNRRYGAAAQS